MIAAITPQENTAGYLQTLCNKYGDFKIARAWKDSKGEMHWSKHHSVMELWESEQGINFLQTANNRQILPVEMVIDLDDHPTLERANYICDLLEKAQAHYEAYFTGSKGYHIHIWDHDLLALSQKQREKVRALLCAITGADMMKKSDKVMIALENAPHWKTGNKKQLLRHYPHVQTT